jgi:RND superfamily putative drug exporter
MLIRVDTSGHPPRPEGRQACAAAARFIVRWRWGVLAVWAALGGLALRRAALVGDRLDVRGGTLEATEATRAADMLASRFARDLGETFLVIVTAPASFESGTPRLLLDSLAASLGRARFVRDVAIPRGAADSLRRSRDGRTAVVLVTLAVSDPDSALTLVPAVRAVVRRTVRALDPGGTYHVVVTGDTPLERDMVTVTTQDVERSEWRLLPLTGAILIVAFGSLAGAVLPLLIGALAIVVALALVASLAPLMPMSIYVLNVTTMIGLGVGIDYSLLVVTRFREELDGGAAPAAAVARVLATAGSTVLMSGLCVIVGFAVLLATPLIETRSIGVGGVVVVAVAVLLALTLLPALLAVLGPRIGRPRRVRLSLARWWERWARAVSLHPGRALALGGAALLCLSAPIARLKMGLPARHWWPAGTEAGDGIERLTRLGGVGYVQPVRMLVAWPAGRSAVEPRALRGLRVLSDSLRADPRVRHVQSLVDLRPGTSLLEYALLYSDLPAMRTRHPGGLDALLSVDGRVARLNVILSDTTSLTTAMDVVRHARRLGAAPPPALDGATLLVGGYVAQHVDFQDGLLRRLPLLAGLMFAATALVLGLVFRSVLVPIKAILLNTLSVSATLGLIVLVFQSPVGARLEAIFVAVPVLVFCVVFGLSMDYEVFLLSRIKEAFDRSGDNDGATLEGLRVSAAVITSAAALMVTVFGTFAFARVLVIQLLGFGLAIAVLLDVTIIRLTLVPAVMHLAGRWNWWPGVRAGRGR